MTQQLPSSRLGHVVALIPDSDEMSRVVQAIARGELDTRGDIAEAAGEDALRLALLNQTLDSLVQPLRLAGGAIEQIAHGTIPEFVIDEFRGEYDNTKRNINAFLSVMYGMHREMARLTASVRDGALSARGNDWDFQGNWRDLISGVNATLDAVVGPIDDARAVLQRLAQYDLTARMTADYRGDHAQIKRAVNATADALAGALRQVADVALRLSREAEKLTHGSKVVAQGAAEQARATDNARQMLELLRDSCTTNAKAAADVERTVKATGESLTVAAGATRSLDEAMMTAKTSSEATLSVLKEIDEIAKKTDALASSAATQGSAVAASGRGFAVVADEVRKLSTRCGLAAKTIEETVRQGAGKGATDRSSKLVELAAEFREVARHSAYLAINAAVEAAHVDEAGRGFEAMTAQVRNLSKESKEAAVRSGELIHRSVDASTSAGELAKQIKGQLDDIVPRVQQMTSLAGVIASETGSVADGVADVAVSVTQIHGITASNAQSAADSSAVAANLANLTSRLDTLVRRFRLPD